MPHTKTRERNLWTSFRNGVKHLVMRAVLEINRIENRARSSMPDVEGHYSAKGHGQFWIELKTAARPKRKTTPIRTKFQEGQSYWLNRRWQMGGSAYLLIQVGSGHDRALYLIRGCDAQKVEEGVPEDTLFSLSVMLGEKPTFEDIIVEASYRRVYAS